MLSYKLIEDLEQYIAAHYEEPAAPAAEPVPEAAAQVDAVEQPVAAEAEETEKKEEQKHGEKAGETAEKTEEKPEEKAEEKTPAPKKKGLFAAITARFTKPFIPVDENTLQPVMVEQKAADAMPLMADTGFAGAAAASALPELDEKLKYRDESFSQMLIRKIDEAGISDADCYNRAHLQRQHFNKIKNNPDYRPGKPTVIALGIALGLDPRGLDELLLKAGFALSMSSKFDIIIRYCQEKHISDITDINELLYAYDQELLGSM